LADTEQTFRPLLFKSWGIIPVARIEFAQSILKFHQLCVVAKAYHSSLEHCVIMSSPKKASLASANAIVLIYPSFPTRSPYFWMAMFTGRRELLLIAKEGNFPPMARFL
jgi:hypothetical protein